MSQSLITLGILAVVCAAQAIAQDSPYKLTRGFPADETTVERAHNVTTLRREIEAYK